MEIGKWLYICNMFISIDTKLISIWLENPIKTWWKARKYFRFPHVGFRIFKDRYTAPCMNLNRVGKILDITIRDVQWKDKWDSPRHERNPIIWFILFRRFHFMITFTIPDMDDLCSPVDRSMEYWEYLLNYLHYTHSLKVDTCWRYSSRIFKQTKSDGTEDKPYPILIQPQLFSLNKRGRREFYNLYKS